MRTVKFSCIAVQIEIHSRMATKLRLIWTNISFLQRQFPWTVKEFLSSLGLPFPEGIFETFLSGLFSL